MANLSVRGVEPATLAELKTRARKEKASVNALVLRLIELGLGRPSSKPGRRRYDDLDGLAGSWRKDEAARFDRATAPFEEIDPSLWK